MLNLYITVFVLLHFHIDLYIATLETKRKDIPLRNVLNHQKSAIVETDTKRARMACFCDNFCDIICDSNLIMSYNYSSHTVRTTLF